MELFAPSTHSLLTETESLSSHIPSENSQSAVVLRNDNYLKTANFKELGLCDWVLNVTKSVGYKNPTDIQKKCIPAILQHQDVLAGAETGSGKTASYILPLLHVLSEDPYGIFAIVLAPTRELALQISDQITILGSSASVSVCQVIGGFNFVEQSLQLSRRPHFVVATPGRFRQQLENATPPNLMKVQYLILDEADKLISTGFAEDLEIIISAVNRKKTTCFFSATLTNSLIEISKFALKENFHFVDLTTEQKIPAQLTQSYLVAPAKIKICYLITLLFQISQRNINVENKSVKDLGDSDELFIENQMEGVKKFLNKKRKNKDNKKNDQKNNKKSSFLKKDKDDEIIERILNRKNNNNDDDDDEEGNNRKKKDLIIIFVDTCQKCYELNEILHKFQFESVALNSLMNQSQRISSLRSFKSMQSSILIATDVASRGLDIPDVNYVINYSLPKICSDYIHRVGRTSRAGRKGTSFSLITQHDIHLLKKIESYCSTEISCYDGIQPRDVKAFLIPVAQAVRTVRLDFDDGKLAELQEVKRKRKKIQRQQLRQYQQEKQTAE
jgi:ATP-dependent RNA helicase DDX49/DBP8